MDNANANIPWLSHDVVVTPIDVHPLPKHLDKFLSKFDLDRKEFIDDPTKELMLVLRLLNVEHEGVVCRSFPYTFEGKVSIWYLSLR